MQDDVTWCNMLMM